MLKKIFLTYLRLLPLCVVVFISLCFVGYFPYHLHIGVFDLDQYLMDKDFYKIAFINLIIVWVLATIKVYFELKKKPKVQA